MDENEMACCYLQNLVAQSRRAGSSEIHRQNAISNIENALAHGDYDITQTMRLRRMVTSLESCSKDSPERKMQVVRDMVVPALISLGLSEEG